MAARSAGKKAPAKKKTAEDERKYLCPYCNKEISDTSILK